MKKIQFALFALLTLLIQACSGSDDLKEILATVPSDADYLVTVNLKSLAKKADLGNEKISTQVNNAIKTLGDDSKAIIPLLDGKAGIDYTAAAIFSVDGLPYLTCQVKDTKALKAYLAQNKLENESVVVDDRLWMLPNRSSDAKARVDQFMALSDKASFLANGYAEAILDDVKDLNFYVNIDRVINAADIPMQEVMQIRMVLASVYNSAKYVIGDVEFEKGAIEGEYTICDENFKPAKPAMKLGKINDDIVKAIPGKVDLVFGVALSKDAVRKIMEQYGQVLKTSGLGDILSAFNGTAVVGMNLGQNPATSDPGVALVMELDNNNDAVQTASLWEGLIGGKGTVTVNDNLLVISTTLPKGAPSAIFAEELSDNASGFVWDFQANTTSSIYPALKLWKYLSITTKNNDEGTAFEMKAVDPSASSLDVLLETIPLANKAKRSL